MFGIVSKMFDKNTGMIMGEDNKLYHFSKINYLEDFDLKQNDKVLFKPVNLNKLNTAIMIIKK